MGTTPLFNPNDGLTGRNGGPYLDEVQAREDEVRRALVEGREPDLEAPGANAGIQLSTAAQMLATLTVQNNPSMAVAHATAIEKAFAETEKEKDVLTSPIFDEIPDTSDQPSNEDLDEDDDPTLNSTDVNAPSEDDEDDDLNLVSPDEK